MLLIVSKELAALAPAYFTLPGHDDSQVLEGNQH